MNINKTLSEYIYSLGLKTPLEALDKIIVFLDMVCRKNNVLNLVGTVEKEKIFVRHFLDCLSIYSYLSRISRGKNSLLRIIDIGSGAGLPGILISIINQDAEIILLDSRRKIARFLGQIIDDLAIDNAKVICERAEKLSHLSTFREGFDIVTARAVARVNILCELMLPFCKIGGKAVMYKSKKLKEELAEAGAAITIMGSELEEVLEVQVPYLNEPRTLLVLNKVMHTEYKYPRKYAKIIKKPLVK